jgi:hypothetical protein
LEMRLHEPARRARARSNLSGEWNHRNCRLGCPKAVPRHTASMSLSPVRFALRTLRLRVRERGQNSKGSRNEKRELKWIVTNPPAGREERMHGVVRLDFDLLGEEVATESDAAIEGHGRKVGAAAAFGFDPGEDGRGDTGQSAADEIEQAEIGANRTHRAAILRPVGAQQ